MRWILSILTLPVQRWHWAAAEDARREGRWDDVSHHLEALHHWYFESDGSHYLLGIANAQLWRDENAIQEFAKIHEPLESVECEENRHLTLALCLSRMGRWKDALDVIERFDPQCWSSESQREYHRALFESVSFNEAFERETWPLVQKASSEEDWNTVLGLLGPLHDREFGTCTTLVLEADAHRRMGDWEKSLATLDKVGEISPYATTDLNSRFVWLRALALLKLGRVEEYESVRVSVDETLACPADIRDELDRTLRADA